jgi:phage shock protein A
MSANLNSALDKWEDPQKMINLMITQLEETLDKARASLADHKAEKKTLEREKLEFAAAASRWEERASMAVGQNRDDLAREALIEKRTATEQVKRVEIHLAALTEIIAKEETQVTEIHDKLEEVKGKQATLVERAKSARQKQTVESVLKKSESVDIMRHFRDLETKIERMEAEANLSRSPSGTVSTDETFAKMEQDSDIEAQLKALKDKTHAK